MSNASVRKMIVQFATNDSVFKASSASVINPQIGNSLQAPYKGSAKDDADLPALDSDSNSLFDSSSGSDSDNISPQLSAAIRICITQVIPSWFVVYIAEEYRGTLTMPLYNPNNKINRCATLVPKSKKRR